MSICQITIRSGIIIMIIIIISSKDLSRQTCMGSFPGFGRIQCWVPNGGCYFDSIAIICQIFSVLKIIADFLSTEATTRSLLKKVFLKTLFLWFFWLTWIFSFLGMFNSLLNTVYVAVSLNDILGFQTLTSITKYSGTV